MTDRKKVIRGLECLAGEYDMESNKCAGCGYRECATFALCIGEIARDALSLMKAQEPGWISVKDRMPEYNGEYIVHFSKSDAVLSAYYFKNQGGFRVETNIVTDSVLHWMPLPEPPKEHRTE